MTRPTESTKAAPADPKNTVQSLAKGFKVLQAFTAQEPELTMAEVARKAGLDNATAFRFLNTLVGLGYVDKVDNSRLFRLSLNVLDLGFHAIARSDLRTLARPVLRGLVGEVNEAASIGVLDGSSVVYVERVQAGLTQLGVDVRIGSRVAAYSSAVGQAILAWLPQDQQVKVLRGQPLVKLTETTLTDIDALLERLAQIRALGYAVSNQETVAGLYVMAAPVLDIDGLPVASLSVAAPAHRSTLRQFEENTIAGVVAAAGQLSKSLQATGGYAGQGR
ncbi:UNVERIFIED_ORG: IclR family transcriptional regulator [Zoogloea ramigera]|uniref:IclR family transcriptional regulator C-terminal domain-containing protein n=1 Tax=Duganella zoogloeoides TaxID=75659 RepID=A0ABZ0Y348_9BURK|nr:IclR family transcriptional regulator C-terminal domain-containing protein [Duganella zoogloeoides]WQH06462.1 IclR family transcriptional regulator C-terminal domain-containing protein [Duganella zoogloeoides]